MHHDVKCSGKYERTERETVSLHPEVNKIGTGERTAVGMVSDPWAAHRPMVSVYLHPHEQKDSVAPRGHTVAEHDAGGDWMGSPTDKQDRQRTYGHTVKRRTLVTSKKLTCCIKPESCFKLFAPLCRATAETRVSCDAPLGACGDIE